jgi:hypothetical protein
LWNGIYRKRPPESCRNAVAKFVAFRIAQNLEAPSLETGSYCTARQSLPEELFSRLARQTGQELHGDAKDCWKFGGRNIKVIDGSTVSMPDESANVAYFGKSTNQRGEVGFPIARLVAVFCLATGALIEMVVSPYVGKRTGELSLFRQLLSTFMRGDILLADQQFCTYCDIARLRANGVDVVMRMREDRKRDFRKGKRLGRQDHVVNWTRPDVCPDWLTPKEL